MRKLGILPKRLRINSQCRTPRIEGVVSNAIRADNSEVNSRLRSKILVMIEKGRIEKGRIGKVKDVGAGRNASGCSGVEMQQIVGENKGGNNISGC